MFDLWNSISCRSETRSIFELGLFSNSIFNYALAFVLGGQFLVVQAPVLNPIFQTTPLSFFEWGTLILLSSIVFWIEELRKFTDNKQNVGSVPLAEQHDHFN
jgi:Ca2+-transporting ATPase